MFFSGRVVEELVVDLAKSESLDTDLVNHFIYHLKLPGDAIPAFVAQVIAHRPSIGKAPNYFPGRVAFGIIDDSLLLFDEGERYQNQTRLCRQVERVRLALAKLEHPVRLIEIFENRLSVLLFATSAANDLGAEERPLGRTEQGILSERLLEAFLVQAELTVHLLERVTRYFKSEQKRRLKERVSDAVREGMNNEPWDENKNRPLLVDLDEPIRFRRELVNHHDFEEAAWFTLEQVARICH